MDKNKKYKWDWDEFFEQSNPTVSEYILTANNLKRLVYCRFGDKYLEDLSKRR